MESNNDRTLAREQYQLEGYKDLSRWNEQDDKVMIALDRFLITASVGACLLTLAKAADAYPAVYLGSVLVLYFWILLSLRYKARLKHRWIIMHGIEDKLGFRAHCDYNPDDLTWGYVWGRDDTSNEECEGTQPIKKERQSRRKEKRMRTMKKALPNDIKIRRRFFYSFIFIMFPPVILGWCRVFNYLMDRLNLN